MKIFARSEGRITLQLHLLAVGKDFQVILTGGDAHIGAVAVSTADGVQKKHFGLYGHRELDLAQDLAIRLAQSLRATICVSVGIHYPDISKSEIALILSLAEELVDDCIVFLQAK